ncbi:hypothetical protein BJ322DRAFT_868850 [Thelephora terrestris]|uniref:C2H2-type domain-containing protein n=1 Tax=Thelephora terrestris TaxID=56493 RepID=A0A9P6HFF2_9AGAM|nr:hypothetical protein BJ322DRAFT_868850 [Thelephora terrestris]
MSLNTDHLLVAYKPPPKTLRPSASEVYLRHPLQRSDSSPAPTPGLPNSEPERRSTVPRYEARGGTRRSSPSYASSSSDFLSVTSHDDDERSVEKSSPEPSAPTSGATAEANPWDQYVEKLGVSKYQCTYVAAGEREPCGQRGDKRHLVTRHIKAVHLRIRPFKCTYCERSFPSNSGLETHINTHTGETPYVCPFCQRGFADRAGLHRHKVKEHDYQPRSRRSQPVFMPPEIHPHG